jgi:DNA-binding MarR family transcriptional regulator
MRRIAKKGYRSMQKQEDTQFSADDGPLLFSYFTEIGIISQLSSALFQSVLPDGLTIAQFGVLNWFCRVDTEATPGRLAKAFQVTGGAMTNTLKRLENQRLIKIEPDPNSGRKKRVTITELGRETRDGAISALEPLLAELTQRFDKQFIVKQISGLAEVREFLDERRYR